MAKKSQKKAIGPHRFTNRIAGKAYCWKCGLIALNNEASRKEAAKPCRNHLEGDD